MVLEIKMPHGKDFASLAPLIPVFPSYVLSFIYVDIFWNNHHHMLNATDKISGNYPYFVPEAGEKVGGFVGWMLLSHKKPVGSSSTL